MPRVSVIIPTYNRAEFLSNAINSVLTQSFHDLELIIVDDGSTDHTRDVVERIDDARVRYFYQTNSGIANARNAGARFANGDYLLFLDHDDLLLPRAVETGVHSLDSSPTLGFVAGGVEFCDQHGRKIGESRPWTEGKSIDLETCIVSIPALPSQWFMRREWFDRIGGFDVEFSKYNSCEDSDFLVRLCLAGCECDWTHTMACQKRLHEGNASRNVTNLHPALMVLLEKTWSNPWLPARVSPLRAKAYASAYLLAAEAEYRSCSVELAKADLGEALLFENALLDGEPPRVLVEFEGMANSLGWPDSVKYLRKVFSNLPVSAHSLARHRRESLGRLAIRMAFLGYSWGDMNITRAAVLWSIVYDPSRLRNRGVLSILIECIVGGRLANAIRRVKRRVTARPGGIVWRN